MRDLTLKPRETKKLSPEKLLSILRGIYPEETAQELFNHINENVDDSEAEDGLQE